MRANLGRLVGFAGIGAIALGAVATVSTVSAQETVVVPMQDQVVVPGRPMPPMQHEEHMRMMPMMMGGGGNAQMIDDNDNVYILRGNTLFKIGKRSMKIDGQVELPRPEMPRMPMMDDRMEGGMRPPRRP